MYPIERLIPSSPGDASPGSLLFGAATGAPSLRFDVNDAKLAVRLGGVERGAFSATNITGRLEPELAFQGWSLRANPKTAFSTFADIPERGQAFVLADGTTGFVISLDSFTTYVTTNGVRIPEPTLDQGVMFFREWSIGVELDLGFVEFVSFGATGEDE